MIRGDDVGELRVARELNEEVRAQRDDQERATFRIPCRLDKRGHERRALFLGQLRGEKLLEPGNVKDGDPLHVESTERVVLDQKSAVE